MTSFEVNSMKLLILVSMDREGSYLYTGSEYRGMKRSVKKIKGGGCNNPLRRTCYKKYLRRTRVKVNVTFISDR